MSEKDQEGKLAQKVKELEERVRRLEQDKEAQPEVEEAEPTKDTESIAGSTLKGLVGGIMPGLGDLISSLEKSDAFQERLKSVDAEIETRLRTGTLQGTGGTERRGGRAPILGKPPGAKSRLAKRTAPPAKRKPPVTVEEPLVDVFDEEDHIRVVAALPGVDEKDIKVDLNGAQLVVSADTPDRKYRKEITLPDTPKGEVERMYKNGILGITLSKDTGTSG